jgi:hypothetical protein
MDPRERAGVYDDDFRDGHIYGGGHASGCTFRHPHFSQPITLFLTFNYICSYVERDHTHFLLRYKLHTVELMCPKTNYLLSGFDERCFVGPWGERRHCRDILTRHQRRTENIDDESARMCTGTKQPCS